MSRFETFGLIPLESMGCGTPVVATNIGGHRETVVNDVTGFLVDPDPKEIANKINELVQSGTNSIGDFMKAFNGLPVDRKLVSEVIREIVK